MEMVMVCRRAAVIVLSAAFATSFASAASDPIERVVEILPENGRVLLVSQGLYHEHPQCPTPIEGDSKGLGTILIGLLESRRQQCHRAVEVKFIDPHIGATVFARGGPDPIMGDARHLNCSLVLYFQATKRYRWDLSRQEYLLRTVDWTFRLHDIANDRTTIVQGPLDIDANSAEGRETMPVSCNSR
jgi:hypothetical protein